VDSRSPASAEDKPRGNDRWIPAFAGMTGGFPKATVLGGW